MAMLPGCPDQLKRVEFCSSDIGDSPIAREDHEFELALSLLWQF